MKNEATLQSFDITKVKDLESYLLHLGIVCISVQTLVRLQEKADSLGIFDSDEEEASRTVQYQAEKLFKCVDDLLHMTISRTGLEWGELMTKVIALAKPDLVKTLKKSKKKNV